jgi:hypothetical protein
MQQKQQTLYRNVAKSERRCAAVSCRKLLLSTAIMGDGWTAQSKMALIINKVFLLFFMHFLVDF